MPLHCDIGGRFGALYEPKAFATYALLDARCDKKRGWADLKRIGDLAQVDHCHVVLTSLDPTHVGPVNACEVSQGFLRNIASGTRTSDRIA